MALLDETAKGVYVIAVTPFTETGALDLESTDRMVDFYLEKGATGLTVLGNEINPLSYLLLAALVFRLAFTRPPLSDRLLHRNDVSYGIYIYHMPVINLLVHHGFVGSSWAVVAASLATLLLAVASWFCIERPALRLKRLALRHL